MPAVKQFVRLAAVGDLHYGRDSRGQLQPLITALARLEADILVLCGDLTDYGLPEEAAELARELVSGVKIPIVGVLGNHDYESGAVDRGPQDAHRCRSSPAGRGDGGNPRYRVRRRQGICRRVRPRRARSVGGGSDQALRPRSGRRSVEAGVRARPPAHADPHRAVALRPHRRNRRRRTARDLPVARVQPPGGSVDALPRRRRCSTATRTTARRRARRPPGSPVYNVSWPLLVHETPDQPVRVLDVALAPA